MCTASPDTVWERLSLVYRSSFYASEIRTVCLAASIAAACFMTRRVFSVTQRLPWSLCVGDVSVNVTNLIAQRYSPVFPQRRVARGSAGPVLPSTIGTMVVGIHVWPDRGRFSGITLSL